MYLVQRVNEKDVFFVTINTGEGVGNHPGYAPGYPKVKRYTSMRLRASIDRVACPSWLYFLFKIQSAGHKDHTPSILYDVALPALVEMDLVSACKTQTATEDPHAIPETLQRSGVCYYRCILSAVRYSLRLLGLKQGAVKQLLHVTRRAFCARVYQDLQRLEDLLVCFAVAFDF